MGRGRATAAFPARPRLGRGDVEGLLRHSGSPGRRGFLARSGRPGHIADPAGGAVFAPDHEGGDEAALRAVRVAALIHAYRVRGHLTAGTDPLTAQLSAAHPELDLAAFGLAHVDQAQDVVVDGFAGHAVTTLEEVLGALREFYCGSAGFEYMHIQDSRERRWIQQRVERPQHRPDRARQLRILYRLGAAEAFETFLQTKYVGHKRYSLEGGESAVVLLDALLHSAIEDGVAEAVIGMTHRGRLNVLANIIGKSYAQIFSEFEDAVVLGSVQGSGDVKYHLGAGASTALCTAARSASRSWRTPPTWRSWGRSRREWCAPSRTWRQNTAGPRASCRSSSMEMRRSPARGWSPRR